TAATASTPTRSWPPRRRSCRAGRSGTCARCREAGVLSALAGEGVVRRVSAEPGGGLTAIRNVGSLTRERGAASGANRKTFAHLETYGLDPIRTFPFKVRFW